jgi:hypothetical protein
MRSHPLSIAAILALSAIACEKQQPAEKPAPAAPAALEKSSAPDPHAMPPGHPATPAEQPAAAPAPTEPPQAGGLTWTAPEEFLRRAPKSQMRVAEYGLKGAPLAELGVFYFGADQGGTVEANMTRWVGQFTQADGSETKAKRSERKVHDVDVSLVEANGMFAGGMGMPGAPQPTAQPDAMLLGAIAKGPQGSVFFKLTGPRAELEKARPAFDGLIDSLTKDAPK